MAFLYRHAVSACRHYRQPPRSVCRAAPAFRFEATAAIFRDGFRLDRMFSKRHSGFGPNAGHGSSIARQTRGSCNARLFNPTQSNVARQHVGGLCTPVAVGGSEPLGYRRCIAASNDGGRWVFDQSGEPYEFENLAAYKSKRKRERFTRELLLEYLRHFGIRPFDDDFYVVNAAHPAVLLQQTQPIFKLPEFTLEEVVTGVPWQHKARS